MPTWGKLKEADSNNTHEGFNNVHSQLEQGHVLAEQREASRDIQRHGTHRHIRKQALEAANAALQTGGYTCLFLVGWKVGTCLLRRTGRLLFGKQSSQAEQCSAPTVRHAAAPQGSLPQVSPAMHWRPIAAPPPELPQDYKLLASSSLPCSVYTMYHHLLSQQSDFLQQQHQQIGGQSNYTKGPWCPAPLDVADYPQAQDGSLLQRMAQSVFEVALGCGNSGSFVRTCTFLTPRKPPMSTDGQCVQRQQLAVFEGGVLVLAASMNTLNLPYNECFLVNTVWLVKPSEDGTTCTASIYGKVHFIRKPLVAGIINRTTLNDLTNFYRPLLPNAEAVLASEPAVPDPAANQGADAPRGVPFLRRPSPSRGSTTAAARVPAGLPGSHSGVPAGLSRSTDGKMLAQTVPLRRQLRVAVVMLFLLGSLVHQLILHQQVHGLHAQLTHH